MPDTTNNYVFCADYSSMASCLAAIYTEKQAGLYHADQVLQDLLYTFEQDLLNKLYKRVVLVLHTLEGGSEPALLEAGDFDDFEFSGLDFLTGYLEPGSGFSSQFQTILNLFDLFCSRETELSQSMIDSIAAVFVPVLDAFLVIEEYLSAAGFDPCGDHPPAYFNNAPEIRLQAAGSDGSNGVSEGILLRWLLNGELGDHHLPQGGYANGQAQPVGFNRADDYVYISRTPYTDPLVFLLDFSAYRPAINASAAKWTYILNLNRDNQVYTNTVSLYFNDRAAYLERLAQVNPAQDPLGFMKGYTGVLEIVFREKTAFRFGLTVARNDSNPATLKLAALARPDAGETEEVPCLRDELALNAAETTQYYSNENIRRVRILMDGHSYLRSFSFETYDDFLKSRPDTAWTNLGPGFGLSLDDTTVFRRLEEPGRVDIDQRWPQYRDGTTLRVANYHDKWLSSAAAEPSVKAAVTNYLSLSQTGADATLSVNLSGREDDPGTAFRYIDLLNLQASDYHFARMFGLGHIDTPAGAAPDARFIYRMTYSNRPSASAGVRTFVYLGIPVGKADLRLPAKPSMRPLSYRLADEEGDAAGQFDAQGYNLKNRVRLVNIGRTALEAEIAESDFFSGAVTGALFDQGLHCSPVLFGIEYRAAGQSDYALPYITDDKGAGGRIYYAWNSAYHAAHGTDLPETVLLPDNDTSLFVHLEKKPGVHEYAIYGVDLFARASALSDSGSTDETVFPPDNQLKPPSDLTVQYVQRENTLIFTSEREQNWLSARDAAFPGMDTSFTRLTFNWVDITDVSGLDDTLPGYLDSVIKGNRAGVFYRPGGPLQVSGLIQAVTELSDTSVRLITTGYTLLGGAVQQPQVGDTDLGKFAGSLLLAGDGQYTVLSVANLPGGPGGLSVLVITVAKNRITEMADEDPENPGSTSTRSYYVAPARGSRFTLAENLGEAGNWQPLQKSLKLIDHSSTGSPFIETVYDGEGNPSKFWVGGIHAQATVSVAKDNTGNVLPGYYQVLCVPGTVLTPHPQSVLPFDPADPLANSPASLHEPYVEWYNGKVFLALPGDTGEQKSVDVVAIKNSSPLTLYAYDPGYLSGDRPILTPDNPQRVMTVNYHPGYRAYLLTEPGPGGFNRDSLLPAAGANDKKSMLALQAIRQTEGSPVYVSAVSLPAILLALYIQQPLPPERPQAATLKVRPDATGRAAFTFDLPVPAGTGQLKREPFGWNFYRTHNELVLHSLYLPATVDGILADLAGFRTDPFFADRYLGLLDLQFDPPGSGLFKQYPVTTADDSEASYGFPVPDLPELHKDREGNDLPAGSAALIANYEQAIHTTLLPLTEQTPVLACIRTGQQTDNKPPVIRNRDGVLLGPGDPDFNPFPMIRQYPGSSAGSYYVRFTDYTLRGSARFLYFYAAAEVTNRLEIGPLGGFTGPVTVLDTLPREAPVIRSFSTGLNEGVSDSPVAVTFKLSPFAAYDTITGVRVFRASDPEKTAPLAGMDSFLDVPLVSDPLTGGLTATDDFSEMAVLPLGETVYYRLAFVRQIRNELEQEEAVLSLGSDVTAVKLIDMFNPEAPELNYDPATHELQWQPTANKGTYFLYRQNSRGNWQVISQQANPDNQAMSFPVTLPGPDENGNVVYSRFKVRAQNASGLFSLSDKELTV
ncbi:hypothetical protein ACFFGT_10065 [Mucilaginibacter angelicae]|uniref:Fibronectin type-III domain-containing protein n=1 Tax=Mucilaginibacter angelicae TaxID=869718 RepID=A0ABV6L4Z9_9SPHI